MPKESNIIVEQAVLSADPSTPGTGRSIIYAKSDGYWYHINSDAVITRLSRTTTEVNNWNDAYAIAIGLNKIISGNATWSGTGLVFNITPSAGYTELVWNIQGTRYTAASTTITLNAADATNPRIDVIYFDSSGLIGKLTGTPAASPAKPVVDPTTQIELTSVNIAANATTPTITGNITAYNENTEFTVASSNGTLNAANTTAPKTGTKHISIGSFTNGQTLTLTGATTYDASQIQYLTFSLRLLASFANNTFLSFYFANGSTPVSNQVSLSSGSYGFSRTTTGSYQDLAIPVSAFTFTSTTFNRIYIVMNGSNASGFYLDLVVLQGGITQPPTTSVTSFTGAQGTARTGAVNALTGDYTVAQVTGAAALASPALTGNPTAPTQTAGNNSTRLATTAYVDNAVVAAGFNYTQILLTQIFS